MESESSRSDQVTEGFIKRKVAVSAMRKIHALIQQWENDRRVDARVARLGLLALLLIIIAAAIYYLNTTSVIIS